MSLTNRSVASVIIFSIITCGIYGIYWFVVTTNDIESSLKRKDGSVSSGGTCFLLSIVTCGIYMYYWYYKQGARLAQLQQENRITPKDNGLIYLLLGIFGLGIIADVIIQSDINAIVDSRNGAYNQGNANDDQNSPY